MKGENSKLRIAACAAMAVVTVVTVSKVRDFTGQVRASQQTWTPANTQTDLPAGDSSNAPGTDGVPVRTEAEYAAAVAFARQYSGEWNVQKYFDGTQWKIYELGKRLAIVAYNYLNDYSYDTGGYTRSIGRIPIYEYTILTNLDEIVTERVEGYSRPTTKGEVLEKKVVGSKPAIQEEVPLEHHEFHGTDIEYSTPAITISDEIVDMSEMGGPVYDLVMFRVETIGGQEYLINDDFGFAITYDGDYLEYCEPDAYGHYQGYYAFV